METFESLKRIALEESAEKLKMVSIWATTCHYVDLQTAGKRGIVVTHVPGYATEAVAERVFALLLASIRKLPSADEHVRRGNFDWRSFGGIELAGKTLGVISTGSMCYRTSPLRLCAILEPVRQVLHYPPMAHTRSLSYLVGYLSRLHPSKVNFSKLFQYISRFSSADTVSSAGVAYQPRAMSLCSSVSTCSSLILGQFSSASKRCCHLLRLYAYLQVLGRAFQRAQTSL